jgi:hypothetical protein
MKDFKYEKANTPLFYVNQAKAYASGKISDLRSSASTLTAQMLVAILII